MGVENVGCQVDALLEQACCGGGMRAAASAGEIFLFAYVSKKNYGVEISRGQRRDQ